MWDDIPSEIEPHFRDAVITDDVTPGKVIPDNNVPMDTYSGTIPPDEAQKILVDFESRLTRLRDEAEGVSKAVFGDACTTEARQENYLGPISHLRSTSHAGHVDHREGTSSLQMR